MNISANIPADSLLANTYQQWLTRVAPEMPASLRAAIEELLHAVEAGHVCIRLPAEFSAEWENSAWVGRPGAYTPFIVDDTGRFYLARYWLHEDSVAALLCERATKIVAQSDVKTLQKNLSALFADDANDQQRLAALLAQFKPLTLVSGGPGTGKTTTVIKMLALLQMQQGGLRILLAAPTGKAAQRLTESIRASKEKLALTDAQKTLIPEDAQTLHRLLGAQGDTGRFRHNEANPLACDLLLIDEASMIDLAMMHAVLAALPADARLVLLGDRDQLASVEAGSVFGDLCNTQGFSAALREALQPYGVNLSIAALATTAAPTSLLADCRVELTHSYRFNQGSGIALLANAARDGRREDFIAALVQPPADIHWERESSSDALKHALQKGYADFRHITAAEKAGSHAVTNTSVTDAFLAFQTFRVLCAHRQGWRGVEGLNTLMEGVHANTWYAGRPIIIRENNYALRLFNGDIGICLQTAEGLRVFFESSAGEYRAMAPGRLPAYEPAWAMTVHQAQGSEFDAVMLVLPETITPVLDRPLIYTAITRAKKQFSLHGAAAVISESIARLPQRESGLVEKLQYS
jgi:exodeoxyribonuclease V alpha subunit